MEPKIGKLAIENFRTFKSIEIDGLKRVNLFTGRNNAGKSSILEAIQLLTSSGSPYVIRQIMDLREESFDGGASSDIEDLFPSSLFNGFPRYASHPNPIVVLTNGGHNPMRLKMEPMIESDLPALGINLDNLPMRIIPIEDLAKKFPKSNVIQSEVKMPCIYISPNGAERTNEIGSLWDKIALSDGEIDVIEGLRIIDPDIVAVSMIGGENPSRRRTAIVRTKNQKRALPLRSFGDGLNRLFGIILALVNATGGLLLIDEFENGLHHTTQADIWRAIFKLSHKLDVQVFATSHSWDAVEAFQKAASESPGEDGALIRLIRKGEDIIPVVFSERELAIATRDRIEVR